MSAEPKKPLSADESAFVEAATKGDVDKVRELLAKGVPVDVRNSEIYTLGLTWDDTALMNAAYKGQLEVVRVLLHAGASVAAANKAYKEDGGGGSQPLHYAMEGKHLAVAEALLDAGADPNAVGGYGRTPLVVAIAEDDIEGVRLLLKRGADVRLKPSRKDYKPPLCAAVQINKRDSFSRQFRNPEIFKLVFAAGADPNMANPLNQTPLIELARQPDVPDEMLIPLMEALLKAGVKVDHKGWMGNTALHAAIHRHNPQAVKLLAGAGADVNRPSKIGTPLDVAEHKVQFWQRQLDNLASTSPARAGAGETLKRAREVCDTLRGFGAKRQSELPPTAATEAVSPESADPVRLGAAHFLKFIYNGEAEWSLLAVKAPLKPVADAFMKLSKAKKRERDVPLKAVAEEFEEVAPLVALVQPWDNPWTVIFRTLFHVNEAALNGVVEDARLLSRQLKTKAIAFVAEDTSGALGYDLFEKGKLLERAAWVEGAGFHSFESTSRKEPDLNPVDDKFADEIFRQLGIYLPACYPITKGKRSWLAVEKPSAGAIERADLIAL